MTPQILTAHEGHYTVDFNTVNPQDVIFGIFQGVTTQLIVDHYVMGTLTADEFDDYNNWETTREDYDKWEKQPFIVAKVVLQKGFYHERKYDNKFFKNNYVVASGWVLKDVLERIAIQMYDVQHSSKSHREDWVSLVAEFQQRKYGVNAWINWDNRWKVSKRYYGEDCIVDSYREGIENQTIQEFMTDKKGSVTTYKLNWIDAIALKQINDWGVEFSIPK